MKYKIRRRLANILAVTFVHCVIMLIHLQAGAPGDLDTTFGSGGKVLVQATRPAIYVRLQADGKIVTLSNNYMGLGAWDYAWAWDAAGSAISRHNGDGTLDVTFGNNGSIVNNVDNFFNFAIQGDGKLVIAGQTMSPVVVFALFRFNPNGTPDLGFGNAGVVKTPFLDFNRAGARGVAFQSDGKIVSSGWAESPEGTRLVLARHHPDGTLDMSFGSSGISLDNDTTIAAFSKTGNEIVVSAGGKLIVSGHILAQKSSMLIAQYHSDGTRDESFGTNGTVNTGIEFGYGIGLQTDGKILVNGFARNSPSFIKRYDLNGMPDTSFGSNGVVSITEPDPYPALWGIAQALAIQEDGKILTAGDRGGTFAISRYTSNGSIDSSFGTGGVTTTTLSNSSISALSLQSDGKIVAAGYSRDGANALVRYLGDTASSDSEVSGQVLTPGGLGLRNATVTITHRDGSRRTVTTSSLGYFSLANVETGYAVSITVTSRRYRFEPQYPMITGNLSNINFLALE